MRIQSVHPLLVMGVQHYFVKFKPPPFPQINISVFSQSVHQSLWFAVLLSGTTKFTQ